MPIIVVDVMPKAELLDPQGKAVAGALARLIQAPALAGHADPLTGLGLAQAAFAAQGEQGFAKGATLGAIISRETGHAAIMPQAGSGR